jgi:hypothetical protein
VSGFAGYIRGTLAQPAATFRRLAQEERIRWGWAAVLLVGVLYSIVCAIAAINGIEPVAEPLLPISKGSYYFWEIFFAPPVFIAAWYLLSYLNLRLGRAFGGKGAVQAILIPLGFALCIPMLPIMWTTDLICVTFVIDLRTLGMFGQIWNVFYQTFTSLWMIAACVIATREVHQFSPGKAIGTTIISAIPVASLIAATIR